MARDPETEYERLNSSGHGMRSANVNPSSMNPRSPASERIFRCADLGNADCRWEVSGRSDDELLPRIEAHGREHHGISEYDDSMRRRILDSIRPRRAA